MSDTRLSMGEIRGVELADEAPVVSDASLADGDAGVAEALAHARATEWQEDLGVHRRGLIRKWVRGHHALTYVGVMILVAAVVFAAIVPMMAPPEATLVQPEMAFQPPFKQLGDLTLLGTDNFGRSMVVVIAQGLRTSLVIGTAAIALAVLTGLGIGLLAGYSGGLLDSALMRITEIQMGLPFVVLAIMFLAISTPGTWTLAIVLSLAVWPIYARVIRSVTRVERRADYVVAGVAIGASRARIMREYLLPGILGSVLALSTLDLATVIIYEALLGFLGIGVPPDTTSLGSVMADGAIYLTTSWWITTLPAVAIFVVVLALNLLGIGVGVSADKRAMR